ncbi:TetR/AcrR family transcriptional regulator [Paenactinomyces guangxiensis]|uniref:TetR/AcrR family transcriptional regulator n=1 Tax=Paenactinomyces guangxiensis TaxID=1490290 RepID=A0A7W1WRC8_9BACL|nr:TetR/AcrR family transcriptional regulator [Paenactinomyces guangxiensis]MBA4494504.1 TetR/AcrR family transcriptional regulator [Paenactinomyces guangxiensis]MBH8591441.1 TetR/AcrR family transcriptional regulator [Paenactinomyces guangxiensis]
MPDQQTRLLTASLKAFTENGYLETSVQDIVTIARTSKTTFYKYYKNKDALLIHLFQLVATALIETVEVTLKSYPPTSERTYQGIKTYIDTCFRYRDIAKLLMVDTVGLCPELESRRLDVYDHFARIFQRELSCSPDQTESIAREKWVLSHAMVGAVNQIVIQSVMLKNLPPTELLAGVLEKMLSKILRDESPK